VARPGQQDKFTQPGTATNKPVIAALTDRRSGGKHQNEIYVDLLERLTVIFNSSVRVRQPRIALGSDAAHRIPPQDPLGTDIAEQGALLKCEIDGSLSMKSYLTGSPEIRLGLNSELVIGRQENAGGVSCSFATQARPLVGCGRCSPWHPCTAFAALVQGTA